MSDVLVILNLLGLTQYIVGLVIAFAVIAVFFKFIDKA